MLQLYFFTSSVHLANNLKLEKKKDEKKKSANLKPNVRPLPWIFRLEVWFQGLQWVCSKNILDGLSSQEKTCQTEHRRD